VTGLTCKRVQCDDRRRHQAHLQLGCRSARRGLGYGLHE
jgi:hypothetical protein